MARLTSCILKSCEEPGTCRLKDCKLVCIERQSRETFCVQGEGECKSKHRGPEIYGGKPLSWSDNLKYVDFTMHPRQLVKSSIGLRRLHIKNRKYVEYNPSLCVCGLTTVMFFLSKRVAVSFDKRKALTRSVTEVTLTPVGAGGRRRNCNL